MMQRYDVNHPEYDAWLIGKRVREARTCDLLRALASRDVRAELHYQWRKERCNPSVAYSEALDVAMIAEIANHLEARIDR